MGSIGRYEIRRNNVAIPGSVFTSQATGSVSIEKTIQTSLVAGDNLTVGVRLANGPAQYASAAFTVNLIGS